MQDVWLQRRTCSLHTPHARIPGAKFLFQSAYGISEATGAGCCLCFFFFQAEDGIRDSSVTGVQTCALPISAVLHPLRAVPTVRSLHDYKAVCPTGCKLLPSGERCRVQAGLVCWRAGCLSLPHWLRDQARYTLVRAGLRSVDRVVVGSRWMRDEFARNGVQAEHVPLPVPAPGTAFRRSPAATPTFVFCGRLQPEKGVPLLLRAFARLHRDVPSARLRIVGRGPDGPAIASLIEALALGDAVSTPGWLDPAALEAQLADASALVAPSP